MRNSTNLEKTRVIAISVAAVMLIITGFVQPALALRSATGPTDRAELEAFMDGIVEAQLEAMSKSRKTEP
jgi:hypothetical protein